MYDFKTRSTFTEDIEKHDYELSDPHPDLHLYPPMVESQPAYDFIEDVQRPQTQTQPQDQPRRWQSRMFSPVSSSPFRVDGIRMVVFALLADTDATYSFPSCYGRCIQ